ncbi:formyl peptide receptor 2-like [Engystomops pustulosus]|uniref:formyl peptide receptor 2-like n=1 Tax=Engystomops pustulosus TaxID=76066 RepID=UPI003AFAAFD6
MDPADDNLTSPNTTGYPDYYNWSSEDYFQTRFQILKKMSFTLYSIIFILGIIGNGLVIWIAGFRMKKTISSVWFLHLAIADFLCCASLPLRVAMWIHAYRYSWLAGILCTVNIILFCINMSASVLLLTAMSVDRWVSVMWPFWAKVHRTQKRVRITAGIIWLLSLLWTGLVFYLCVSRVLSVNEWCLLFDSQYLHFKEITKIIHLMRLFILFVIPFLIIVTSYVTIACKLKKSKRPQRSQRPYRIITAVILGFFICWAPYYMWPIISMYDEETFYFYIVYVTVIILACFNSCINPIIYVFMGQYFRHSFLRSIPFRLEKALSEHPDPYEKQQDYEPSPTTDV